MKGRRDTSLTGKSRVSTIGLWKLWFLLVATWIWDSTALAWRTWSYSPERTLGISLGGVPIETYLTTLLVAPAVAIATLAWANFPLDPIIQGAPYGSKRNISS